MYMCIIISVPLPKLMHVHVHNYNIADFSINWTSVSASGEMYKSNKNALE